MIVLQGAVGFVQYFTDLPVVLVAFHMLGAALVSAAVTWVLVEVREPVVVGGPVGSGAAVSLARFPLPKPCQAHRSQGLTPGSRKFLHRPDRAGPANDPRCAVL